MQEKNIVLAIDDVEPGLVEATKKLEKKLGRKLKGIVLVDAGYSAIRERARDKTGFFKEIVCNFDDPSEIQAALKPYLNKILVATCRQENSIHSLLRVVPFLPYTNTPSESALRWSTEKQLMRDRLYTYDNALTPNYQYLTEYNTKQINELARHLKFPVIVKPAGLAASLLVTLCKNKSALKKCLAQTFEVIHEIYEREQGRGEPSVLVEEKVDGDMFSIDAYVSPAGDIYCLPPVEVITAHSLGLPGFYSYRHIIPTKLTAKEVAAATKVAESAIKALNLSSTTAHIELFNSPDGWKVIELGPRIGGYREDLYRESYGADHYYNDLLVRLGFPAEIPTKPQAHAAGINIYAEKEGHINAILGLEEAKELESVVYLSTNAHPGDIALFAENGGKLIVDGILSNKDPQKLEADVEKVRELITIEVEPMHPPKRKFWR